MGKVILFGEPMALLIADTPGPLEMVEHFTRALSGAEVNVAIGLTRLGHHAEYLTRLGDDPFGHYIEMKLRECGIGTDFLSYDSVYRTGIQLKNRTEHGEDAYAPYYRKGSAASHILPEEIDRIPLEGVDLVHITGIPPALSGDARAAVYHLMERAKEEGIYITFDPNLRPALWESRGVMIRVLNELVSRADLALPGIEECRILAGTDDKEEAAEFFMGRGAKAVVIKDGARGAWARVGEKRYSAPGFHVEQVVDTVGAGDGFAVGVISGILEKLPFQEILRRANAIGALQVMNRSDNEGLPDRKGLEKFLASSEERDKGLEGISV